MKCKLLLRNIITFSLAVCIVLAVNLLKLAYYSLRAIYRLPKQSLIGVLRVITYPFIQLLKALDLMLNLIFNYYLKLLANKNKKA